MSTPRISASSYSNTAPLIWSFLYGSQHGRVELILDNAPARSAALLAEGRVDAALVPVIAYHEIERARFIPGVCVGAKEHVQSVCLVTKGTELESARSVALDISSRTSVVLTKIIFREFLGFEPKWCNVEPDIGRMLTDCDAALIIGDPALSLESESRNRVAGSVFRVFDLANLWHEHTGLGFIFAMWMTRSERSPLDFASARDEGLTHLEEIVSNYLPEIPISADDFRNYLSRNISYAVDDSLQRGMELYFDLAQKHRLCENSRELIYAR